MSKMQSFFSFFNFINNYFWFLYYTYIYGEYTFEYLLTLNGKITSLGLHRRIEIQDNYRDKSSEVRALFINNIKNKLKDSSVYFVINNYPYNVPRYIKHYVLWICPGLIMNNNTIYSAIKSNIFIEFGTHLKFAYFKNIGENKSIMEIDHYHVFIMNIF